MQNQLLIIKRVRQVPLVVEDSSQDALIFLLYLHKLRHVVVQMESQERYVSVLILVTVQQVNTL